MQKSAPLENWLKNTAFQDWPGKAPYQIIVKQIGEGAVIEEAMELLVNDIYPLAIDWALLASESKIRSWLKAQKS